MERENNLKENHVWMAIFDNLVENSGNPDDDYYDEIVIYDGGGAEGYGDSKKD